jgi:hypothetical protein
LSPAPVCPALTTLWTATAGDVRLTAEPSPAPYALRRTGPAPGGLRRSRQG